METEKKLNYKGSPIFYRVYGSGKLVMLVHGFGETGDVWINQVEYLKDQFCLIVPDLPGSGRSEMIEDMSMEGMAEVIKVIMDEESQSLENSLQKEKGNYAESSKVPSSLRAERSKGGFRGAWTSLIGHSMGGYITLAFAEKYDSLLSSFGLFHSTAYADTEEKKATRRKGIEFIREHGAYEFLKSSIPNLFSAITKQRSPELVGQFLQGLNNFSADALVSYYQSMIKRPDRTGILKKTRMPVLFVMGEFDNAIPLQDGLQQSHLPERAYINILHESGHMGMLEEKDKSNRLLGEFLNQF